MIDVWQGGHQLFQVIENCRTLAIVTQMKYGKGKREERREKGEG
jgi:hypothetical protein